MAEQLEPTEQAPLNFYFFKGEVNVLSDKYKDNPNSALEEIRTKIGDAMESRHLSFLLGSGCSSHVTPMLQASGSVALSQVGIPTMQPLAKEFFAGGEDDSKLTDAEIAQLSTLFLDVKSAPFKNNLEKFLEVLFSLNFALSNRNRTQSYIEFEITLELADTVELENALESCKQGMADNVFIESIIAKTKRFILKKCLGNNFPDNEVLSIYQTFYRKLVYRTNTLSKPCIFTTNYDLFSERALDRLGIIYSNGFSGVIDRFFNPAIFNYAFAERIDTSSHKWNAIDNYLYLYKLHGSVNWVEDTETNKLFSIRELQTSSFDALKEHQNIMIYPSPLKHNASLGSPYSDLFRGFQTRIMKEQTVLITFGYSFSDEHINNLIYQSLTIPTFRLIVFADKAIPAIAELIKLNDPRIWVIGGTHEQQEIHYFKFAVEKLLPSLPEQKIEESIEKVISSLVRRQ